MSRAGGLYAAIVRSMMGRYAVYGANLLSMMLLARLFSPDQFGAVAAVSVFLVFFQLLAEAGLGPAIVNQKSWSASDRNGVFGLTLLVGGGLFGLFALSASSLAEFYNNSRVEEVVPLVAGALFFFAASVVPNGLLLREQRFFKLAQAGLAAEVVSTVATVVLLQLVKPLTALGFKYLVGAAVYFFVVYSASSSTEFGRPCWGRNFGAVRSMLAFSGYQFGFNFINYFSRNLDSILVGRYLGAQELGVYDKAYQLMRYPLMLLTFAMAPAIQPVIRQFAHDVNKIELIHRRFTFQLSIAGILAGVFMYVGADFIVNLLLGGQWGGVVPVVRILAVSIPVQVVLSTIGGFFQAVSRTDLLFWSGVISATAMVTAIVWGVRQGNLESLSWALVIAFHVNFLQSYFILYRFVFRQPPWRFMGGMLPVAVSSLGMFFYGDVLSIAW